MLSRLGADDYLLWPVRDVEVCSVVERSLYQVCENRGRLKLDINLKEINQESERRVRDLTTIFAVVKAVLSIRDQAALLYQSIASVMHPLASPGKTEKEKCLHLT